MINDFIEELRLKKIKINFDQGKLKYEGPKQNIDAALISNLKKNKAKLLTHLWPKECSNMFPINTEGEGIPFVLLHAEDFLDIGQHLGYNNPSYGFYHVGSKSERKVYKTIEEFAEIYAKQLIQVIPKGPVILGGMSLGGTIAYQMAICLEKMGYSIPLLILGDSTLDAYTSMIYSPKKYPKLSVYCPSLLLKAKQIKDWYIYTRLKVIHDLFPSSFYKMDISKRTLYMAFKYSKISENFKPQRQFNGKILLFKARDNGFKSQKEFLGWENICKEITLVPFKGHHGYMFTNKETVNMIKTHIQEWISKIEENYNSAEFNT